MSIFLRNWKSRKISCTLLQVKRLAKLMGIGRDLQDISSVLHLVPHWVCLSHVILRYAAHRRSFLCIPANIRQTSALCYGQRGVGRILGRPSRTLELIWKRRPRTASRRPWPMHDWRHIGLEEARNDNFSNGSASSKKLHSTRFQAKHWSRTVTNVRPQVPGLSDTRSSSPVECPWRDAVLKTSF